MPWTHFWDMHSGGSQKEEWHHIFIEAPEHEAEIIFQNRFGHNPHRVTCTCCGSDYSVSEEDDLLQATGYHRNCVYSSEKGYMEAPSGKAYCPYQTLEEFEERDDVLIIPAGDIKPEEREGSLRQQGYVWVD